MKDDTALLRQCLETLDEMHYASTDLTEKMYAQVVAALRKRLNLCPVCGADTRQNHDYVSNIETFWLTCSECDWVGEPE
jgi:DNA repair exonuclease SbcCD ATPase subunit